MFLRGAALPATLLIACLAAPAVASPIVGNVDAISGSTADGWSCIRGYQQPDSVALYAGIHRIGIFPNAVDRPDTSSVCGAGIILNGFKIDLTPSITQQFYGQTNLSLYGINPAAPATLLRPSGPRAADPYLFPSGFIATLSPDGGVSGLISNVPGGNVHGAVAIVAGGPLEAGGTVLGNATLEPSARTPQSFSFTSAGLAALLSASPPGYALPVYAYFSRNAGPAVQLGSPAMLGTTYLPFASRILQTGSISGINSTLFTRWIPPGLSLRGLSGSITFAGNTVGFSEALVTVGTTDDSQPACKLENGTAPARPPNMQRLAAFTLKANDTNPDTIPVSIALPYALPPAGPAGTCLVAWISAGYAFLDVQSAKYSSTLVNLAAALSPVVDGAPAGFAEGIGNAFHFASASEPSLYTVVALKMQAPAQLDAIAVSVSAAGLLGAPQKSGWLPTPVGNWTATTSFYAYPAGDCDALGLSFIDASPLYAVGLNRSPANYDIPQAAALLFSAPLHGDGALATQQTFFQIFSDHAQPGASRIVLSAGDCLVALHNVAATGDSLYGNLDFEDQSTAYFHLAPNGAP
jgi:hypothetical protein